MNLSRLLRTVDKTPWKGIRFMPHERRRSTRDNLEELSFKKFDTFLLYSSS